MRSDSAREIRIRIVEPAAAAGSRGVTIRRLKALHGLLWCEWFAHSKLLLFFLAAWLLCVWVTPLFVHPGWILLFGLLYAVIAGPAHGGSDGLPPPELESAPCKDRCNDDEGNQRDQRST